MLAKCALLLDVAESSTMSPVTPRLLRLLVFIIHVSFHAQYKQISMSRSRYLTWVVLFALVAVLPAAAKDLAVVVNKANETKAVSAAELTKLLKNGTKKWSSGQDVIIVMRDPSTPEMRVLLQKIYGISAEQLKAFVATANEGRSTPAFVIADSD